MKSVLLIPAVVTTAATSILTLAACDARQKAPKGPPNGINQVKLRSIVQLDVSSIVYLK